MIHPNLPLVHLLEPNHILILTNASQNVLKIRGFRIFKLLIVSRPSSQTGKKEIHLARYSPLQVLSDMIVDGYN